VTNIESLNAADLPRELQERQRLSEAIDLLRSALKILDDIDVSDQIGARVDEAIHDLRDLLELRG